VFGDGVAAGSVAATVPLPAGGDPLANTRTDLTELPNGFTFTYWAQSLFGSDKSVPSILAKVTAQNDAPVANNDTFPVGVLLGNVFTNDTDTDGVFVNGTLDKSRWTAVLVSGPSGGALTLNGDGSFAFISPGCGVYTFQYKINTGTFSYQVSGVSSAVPMSDDSNTATVTLTSLCAFVPVANVPPAPGQLVRPGSILPMQWKYASGTTIVNSASLNYTVKVIGPLPGTTERIYTNTNPVINPDSSWYYATTKTWKYNLYLKEANGANYPVGTYNVQIISNTAGFASSPVFQIVVR
jgi:hypothetical protein